MFTPPRATWTVLRLLWMQIALCVALVLEAAIFNRRQLADLFELRYNNIFERGYIWQIFTTTLVHTNPFQMLFNGLTLWMFGSELEQRWGRSQFLKYYLACALGSSLTFLGLSAGFPLLRNDIFATATGANLGLLIAYAVYWPDRQVWFFFLFPLRMKYVALITGLIATMYAVTSAPFALAAAGHLGGLVVAGLILVLTGGELARLDKPFQRLAAFASGFGHKKSASKSGGEITGNENLEIKIDAILDKISRGGMKSLSAAEKKFLRDASDRMNKTRH
jgi:membrane associated rhomboid family serine protease